MWTTINAFLKTVDNFVWGVPLMVLILCGGILLTVRLGVLQMRRLPLALKWMVKNEEGGKGEISSLVWCWVLEDLKNLFLYVVNLEIY